jgi:hypothetical protein
VVSDPSCALTSDKVGNCGLWVSRCSAPKSKQLRPACGKIRQIAGAMISNVELRDGRVVFASTHWSVVLAAGVPETGFDVFGLEVRQLLQHFLGSQAVPEEIERGQWRRQPVMWCWWRTVMRQSSVALFLWDRMPQLRT